MGTCGPVGFWLMAPGDPWERILTDLGVTFGAQNTHGYGSGSPTSALVPSLSGNWWYGANLQTSCWCWKVQKKHPKVLGYYWPWGNRMVPWISDKKKRDQKNKTQLINQHVYIKTLVEKFQLTNAKPVRTPIEPSTQYSVEQCPTTPNQVAKMKDIHYSKAIGSILWQVGMLQCTIWYEPPNGHTVSHDMGSANSLSQWII